MALSLVSTPETVSSVSSYPITSGLVARKSTVRLHRSSLKLTLPQPNRPTSLLSTSRQGLLRTTSESTRKHMSPLSSTYSPVSLFQLHGTRTTTGGFTTTLPFPSILVSTIPTSTLSHGKTTWPICAFSNPLQMMSFLQSVQLVTTSWLSAWRTAAEYTL